MAKRFRTVLTLLALPAAVWAQAQPAPKAKVQVIHEVKHDVSKPLREIAPMREFRVSEREQGTMPPYHGTSRPDTLIQKSATIANQSIPGITFAGVDAAASGGASPSDANGSAGLTQYVQWVNVSFAVYSKTGALLYGPAAGNTLWSGFGGSCETDNNGDVIVLWDKQAQRWLMSQFAVNTPPWTQCLAISTSSDATGTWNRYAFQETDVNDYPKFGVWPDGYYLTFRNFGPGGAYFVSMTACALDRSAMLAGTSATQQCFNLPGQDFYPDLLPSDLDGTTPPPAGSPNYMVSQDWSTSNPGLDLWKFHVDWNNPANSTLTGPTILNVASYDNPCPFTEQDQYWTCVPQPGTSQQLEASFQMMYRLAYRVLNGTEYLVTNQSVGYGPTSVRWYQIADPNGTPAVVQQSTYSPDATSRWMGSAAMDSAGDIAIGYSASDGVSVYPSIRYTGRTPSDPANTMEAEVSMVAGAGASITDSSGRWGDYSSMSIDPVDDCTFWYTTMYQASTGYNWSSQVGTFKFPNCVNFSVTSPPVNVTGGSSAQVSVGTALISGMPETITLSASGLPAGVTASFNPASVTEGGSSTMTISTTSSTALGNYNFTITGASATGPQSTNVALNVEPQPNFTLAASSPVSLALGQSSPSSISTTVIGLFNAAVALSASGLPRGVTASFNPPSIGAPGAGSSTLTLTASTTAALGTFTVTVSAVGGGITQTATISLTVTKDQPIVTFTGAPATALYHRDFTIASTTNDGTTATITAAGPCTYSNGYVTMTSGTGTCKMTAKWPATAQYLSATATQTTTAMKDTTTVEWSTPAPITYGTPLSSTQLDANTYVAGTYRYSPASGAILTGGTHTLNVTFTPSVPADYSGSTGSVTLVVNPVSTTTAITSTTPASPTVNTAVTIHFAITPGYGTATGSVTVNASTGESCTAVLSGGKGSCVITFATSGSRTLTADYGGSGNDQSSVSAGFPLTVAN